MLNQSVKAVADRHILARKNNKFDNPTARNKRKVILAMYAGYTFERVLDHVESAHCSYLSLFLVRHFGIYTSWYKLGVYNGFKKILLKL